jgi:hypothetical protein
MHPDRTNYEIWLIDYLDGNLSDERIKMLLSFLDGNPDIKEEFEDIYLYRIEPGTDPYKGKNTLKRSPADIQEKQFELLCVAASENDLSVSEAEELEIIVSSDPGKKQTLETFRKLKLAPPQLNFAWKSKLHRIGPGGKIIRLSAIGISAAAGIALMVTLFNLTGNKTGNPVTQIPVATVSEKKNNIQEKVSGSSNNSKSEKMSVSAFIRGPAVTKVEKNRETEIIGNDSRPPATDSLVAGSAIVRVNPSIIDFKKEVNLGETKLPMALVTIKPGLTSLPDSVYKKGSSTFIARFFREKIFRSKTPETGTLKGYEVADAGIAGLNKLFGWQMSLQKTKDDKGNIKSLYFSSKILKFNAPLKKVQLQP